MFLTIPSIKIEQQRLGVKILSNRLETWRAKGMTSTSGLRDQYFLSNHSYN